MNVVGADKDDGQRKEIVAKSAGVKRNRSGRITRDKIMDAAEELFALKGVHGASLREIMIAAGVNIAAVNYYFGSKSDLLHAVIHRRASQINSARLEMLEEARKAGNGVPSIEGWLIAIVKPFIDAEGSNDPGWRHFVRVLNWTATVPDDMSRNVIRETYNNMREAFLESLCDVLPNLSREEVNWRYHCVLAVLRSCVAARDRTAETSQGSIDPENLERMMSHIVPFLIAGLTAPPTGKRSSVN